MENFIYILFGWLLGLLSPVIVDKIKSEYNKKKFFKAVCTELYDLQYRIAIASFLLGQRYGTLDNDFLIWIQPYIRDYTGNEPNKSVAKLIDSLIKAEGDEFKNIIQHMRSDGESGLSLKTYTAGFLDSNIGLISNLPIELQGKIHEFRNHLNILNQEIESATENLRMTFDSSITDENHERVTNDLLCKYSYLQGVSQRVVDKLQAVLVTKI